MQTNIAQEFKNDKQVATAEAILRKCVHCGFCLATCPTYNLLGDELDSPRGRIYQIKQVLEGTEATAGTQLHLDRCLTCRNCETTCPSGVEYGQLIDIGRQVVETKVKRSMPQRMLRYAVKQVLPYPARVGPLVKLGQMMRPLLPAKLAASVPVRHKLDARTAGGSGTTTNRKMLLLDGCVQPSMAPSTNQAAINLLARLGVEVVAGQSVCCGAIHQHMNDAEGALEFVKRNIDLWWPHIESGAEAVLITASGCGSLVKEYGHLLAEDEAYRLKAERIATLTRDIGEVLVEQGAASLHASAFGGQLDMDAICAAIDSRRSELALAQGKKPQAARTLEAGSVSGQVKVAFHPPCSLQHGQKFAGAIETLLAELGFSLLPFENSQECCGSAGTYSIFQPQLSSTLKAKKMANLQQVNPDVIATANIGCQLHLQSVTGTPVIHWIELLDAALPKRH